MGGYSVVTKAADGGSDEVSAVDDAKSEDR
jgi:hypothetical protein